MYPAPTTPLRTKALLPLVLLASLLILLPSCKSARTAPPTWNGSTAGSNLDPVALSDMGMAVRWLYQLELRGKGGVTDATVLGDLLVAVEGPDNTVTAIRLADGHPQWKTVLGLDLESLFAPLRAGDRVFVNSAARFFTLDAQSGDLVGVTSLEAPVSSSAVLIGDFAIFGAAAGMAFAHDIDAGYAIWRYRMPGRIVAPPVQSGDNVFVGDEAGTYAMLQASTGDLVFRNAVFGPITASATLHRGDVLLPSQDRSLYALNRATGNQSWVYRATAPLAQSPLSVGRDLYLSANQGGLIALDSDGTPKWTIDLNATPVLATDAGIYATTQNALIRLDPQDGSITHSVRVNGLAHAFPGPDNALILRTDAGRFIRLDPTD